MKQSLHADQLLDDLANGQRQPLEMAISLLQQGLATGTFTRSLQDCHTPGLDSIVLFEAEQCGGGMIRFYWARHGHHHMHNLYNDDGHFLLGVHNHRYRIAKIPLNDVIFNVRTWVTGDSDEYRLYEYDFSSALVEGNIHTSAPRLQNMAPLVFDRLEPGDVSVMAAEDLHTVQVPDREDTAGTAWMVIEGSPATIDPLIYSPRPDLQLAGDGLYQRMPEAQARALTQQVLAAAQQAQSQFAAVR